MVKTMNSHTQCFQASPYCKFGLAISWLAGLLCGMFLLCELPSMVGTEVLICPESRLFLITCLFHFIPCFLVIFLFAFKSPFLYLLCFLKAFLFFLSYGFLLFTENEPIILLLRYGYFWLYGGSIIWLFTAVFTAESFSSFILSFLVFLLISIILCIFSPFSGTF